VTAKTLERILILRTLIALDDGSGCGVPGVQIADRASAECDHDLLENLPPISRRGIGQKLNAMSLAGLVNGSYDEDYRLMFWSVTEKGRELAASLPGERCGCASVAPFVFVAATRCAINRLSTGASQDMAGQVLAHAESIRRDQGCTSAIVREVHDWIRHGDRRGQPGVHKHEIEAAERKWLQVVEALTGGARS